MNGSAVLAAWLSVLSLLWAWKGNGADAPPLFRIGVSYASFGTVGRNDASAALKCWATTVGRERKVEATIQVEVFDREDDLREALAQERVEAVSMTADEFIQSGQQPEHLYLVARDKSFAEHYVLLVHRQGGIEQLGGLENRKLARYDNVRMGPALPWLETVLAEQGLAPAKKLLAENLPVDSPSKTVLRVFFRQSDACLVTEDAFALACELNPQLKRDLKVLMTSPPLLPSVFFFRPNFGSPMRKEFESAILNLSLTAVGQQVLTVFQCSHMECHPLSSFDVTRRILQQYQRLRGFPPAQLPGAAAAPVLSPRSPNER